MLVTHLRFLAMMAKLKHVFLDQFSKEAVSKCWVRSSSSS